MQVGVSNAREQVYAGLDEGVDCPTCDQFSKRYKRKLSSGMARSLIVLYTLAGRGSSKWVRISEVLKVMEVSPEMSKVSLWGLCEASQNEDESKRTSGLWRVTDKGIDFVLGKSSLPARVVIYNNTCEGFEGNQVTIHQALGSKFNYDELMNG